ncbi:MAG: hypothetical protein ACFFBP_05525 [Promethearchaeota archaeon]
MDINKDLDPQLIKLSKKIGLDIIGFADVKHFKNPINENSPKYYQDDSKIVIIVGLHLFDIFLDIWIENKKAGKNFHFLDIILEKNCYKIKEFLSKRGYKSTIIPYSSGFYLKNAAALAGIGPIGKSNLLITDEYGSQVRLRALTTNAPLKAGKPILKSKYCKECAICIKACPAEALSKGNYDKDACLSYNLKNLKKFSNYSSIWCNICIESCPIGKK